MKILIIGLGRTGTTSLLNAFNEYGYYCISEPYATGPFADSNVLYPLAEMDNHISVVVKTTTYQKPKLWEGDWHDFILEFSKLFDRIIFLDREDFAAHYNSYLNLWWKIYNKQDVYQKWRDSDIPISFKYGFEAGGGNHRLHDEKQNFKQLVDKLNGEITWYENLYGLDREVSKKEIEKWNIPNLDVDFFNDFLNPKYKLYQNKPKNSL